MGHVIDSLCPTILTIGNVSVSGPSVHAANVSVVVVELGVRACKPRKNGFKTFLEIHHNLYRITRKVDTIVLIGSRPVIVKRI
jgi:hypothetical protein